MRNLQYLQLLIKKEAGGLQQDILVTGTKSLFADALVAFQGILIPIVLALFVFCKFKKILQKKTRKPNTQKRKKL